MSAAVSKVLGLLFSQPIVTVFGFVVLCCYILPPWLRLIDSTKRSRFKWLRIISTVVMAVACSFNLFVDAGQLGVPILFGLIILSTLVYKGKADHLFAKPSQPNQDLNPILAENIEQPTSNTER